MLDTIAAIATGQQVAAIGIVRMSGPLSIEIADRVFVSFNGRKISEQPDRKLVFGKLISAKGELLDIALCTVSRGPGSYTGEDTAEFQCHGSPMLLQTLLRELFTLGARQAGPGEFTKRAFLNGRIDLSAAEAVIDLIDAESEEAVKNAAGQLGGAIHRKVERIYENLTDLSAHFHAVLDYPDEDIEDFEIRSYQEDLQKNLDELKALLKTFERGTLLNRGIPAAIIGLPNAGKSSLLNVLLGYDRAIVTSVPGTTRDTVEERVNLGGVTLRLIDTAGIRKSEDPVEQLGVERSRQAAEQAELVLAVIDASEARDADDGDLLDVLRTAGEAKRAIVILSKADLPMRLVLPELSIPSIPVSSKTGKGLDALSEKVASCFQNSEVPQGEILTNARQADAVARAAESMQRVMEDLEENLTPDIILTEVECAMSALGELTGTNIREDVTNRIFSRFCVGK